MGVGTLYRHFPTREALIVAAHTQQITLVCQMAPELLTQHPAVEATRRWLEHFLDHATASTDMCAALEAVITSGADPYAGSAILLSGAVSALLDAGVREGSLRADITPEGVLLLVGGVSRSAQHSTREQVQRLLELLMDAITTDTPRR